MTNSLEGRHALVTGGGSGIGAAIARHLAGLGARVTVCGRRAAPLEEIARDHDVMQGIAADVGDEAAVRHLVAAARERFGPVDIVVANAGVAESAPFADTSLEAWNRALAVNLTGAFLPVREVLPQMRERQFGRVVFVASTAGQRGYPYIAAYCASKHGVIGLMRALAREVARDGITSNAVCPGYTETEMLGDAVRNVMRASGRDEAEARQRLARVNPTGRFVTVDEVADAVAWLCMPGSASVTGQSISVSGGET